MKREVVIVNNLYSLLVCLLHLEMDIVILSLNDFEINLREKMKKYFEVIEVNEPKNKFLKIFYLIKLKKLFGKYLKDEFKIYMSCDHKLIGQFFLKNKKEYILYDEGLALYSNYKEKKYIQLIKNTLGLSNEIFGKSKLAKKIYLTGLAPIPKQISHKVEIINLKKLWMNKTKKEQELILDIFSLFDSNVSKLVFRKDIILFTQPLSEDGTITEKEKIWIYSEIIKKYPKDRLVIKVHPRENTNYKEIFKDYLVLDTPFPFEIFNLLDVKFNKAITIFSTAALGLGKDVAVDFYGTEIHSKILKKFGSCDNIMKRNSYLEEE